jgi:hypothetical protein
MFRNVGKQQTYILEEFYLQFECCENLQSITSLRHIKGQLLWDLDLGVRIARDKNNNLLD